MLGDSDIGHRVVVRRFVGLREDRPLFSDVLGELTAATETELTIETARGPVTVPRQDVHLAKTVPPRRRPMAAREVLALERVAAAAWPSPEVDHLGEWLLRAAEGWTGRGNSALPLGDPGRPLPAAIDAVVAWYAARDLRPTITTPLPAAAAVARELAARGWSGARPVLVQTAKLDALLAGPETPGVQLSPTPGEDWLAVVAGRKGSLPAAARHILSAPGQVRFASWYPSSQELMATARGVVDGDWLGLSLVEVAPAARRQGLAGVVMRALAEWARDAGVTRVYLQVEEHNEAAVALYAKLGFTTHHTYVTHRAPEEPVSPGGPGGAA